MRGKDEKEKSGKRERRGDPCGRPGARRTDCHGQCAHWLRNDGLFARGTVKRRDTWVPPYTALFCRGGRPCPPGSARSLWYVGEGLSCPPSCQPISGHCRVRQSGHFLETGALHPPPAALGRVPRPRGGRGPRRPDDRRTSSYISNRQRQRCKREADSKLRIRFAGNPACRPGRKSRNRRLLAHLL